MFWSKPDLRDRGGSGTVIRDQRRPRIRRLQISKSQRPVDRQPDAVLQGRPALVRPDQMLGHHAGRAPDARIQDDVRREPCRSARRRPGHQCDQHLPAARHADGVERAFSDGNHRAAGDDLHPRRPHPRHAPAHLYRRPRMARSDPGRASTAIRSASGSTPTATAITTCSRSRRARFKGPRSYDASGLPLHRDNKSVIKERIYLDKANPNLLHNDITVTDDGLTQPWSVQKTYRRNANPQSDLDRVHLRRGPAARSHRQRQLHAQRRRLSDADQKGPDAAGPEIFQPGAAVTVMQLPQSEPTFASPRLARWVPGSTEDAHAVSWICRHDRACSRARRIAARRPRVR